jgi:hypothetical protein
MKLYQGKWEQFVTEELLVFEQYDADGLDFFRELQKAIYKSHN